MEWIFFSLILFACVCTNYYQEYITLKQRSTIHCIGSRKYQNENCMALRQVA